MNARKGNPDGAVRGQAGKASPEAGDNPGYAEDEPRDRADAHAPHGRDDPPSPDEGGVERDTDGNSVDEDNTSDGDVD